MTTPIDAQGKVILSLEQVIKAKVVQEYGSGTIEHPLNLVAIADGAKSIRCRLESVFKQVTIILDWYHLGRKVRKLIGSIDNKKMKLQENHSLVMLALFFGSLIDFVSYGIVVPLVPFYAKSFDAPPIVIGLLLGVYDFMGVFAPSLWGSWSDIFGRRRAMLTNIAGTASALLIFGLANSLWMLFVARILSGASGSSIVIAQSYVTQYTTDENRTRDLGLLEASAVFGLVIGPAMAGFLVGSDPENINYHLPGLTAAGLSLLTFCFIFVVLPSEEHLTTVDTKWTARTVLTNVVEVLQRPLLGKLMITLFVLFFAQAESQSLLPLWFNYQFSWGPQQYSYILILCALLIAATQIGLLGMLSRRFGDSNLVLWGFIGLGLGGLFLPFATTEPLLLGAIFVSTLGQGISNPAITSLIVRTTEAKQQGKTLGIARSISSLGAFTGAIGGGFVFQAIGPAWPYWISGFALLATVILSQSLIKSVSGNPEQSDSTGLHPLREEGEL